jgi:hypothetical protein
MASVAIAGSVAQRAGYGGHAWALLQYPLGFQQLGYKVLFIDQLTFDMATDRHGRARSSAFQRKVDWFVQTMAEAGLEGSYALLVNDGAETVGLSRQKALEQIAESVALINVMGFIRDAEILAAAPKRVFLDIDPGFPQMWRELGQHDSMNGHSHFVTIGENIGRPHCSVPTCGLRWITTPPPIVLDRWPAAGGGELFTTVGTWRGPYDAVEYRGARYGLRAHEFRRFAMLPRLARRRFEAVLDIEPADNADRKRLSDSGWRIAEPSVVGDLASYQAYIQRSQAEIMIPKGMYIHTQSGWFSDRSVCYLASGKPVLAQDTGFTHNHPTGEGLLSFTNLEEAVAGVDEISCNYARHSTAARALAQESFDSRKVLPRLLDKILGEHDEGWAPDNRLIANASRGTGDGGETT